MNYGYVRVSTREQNEDRQVVALVDADVDKSNIFIDKESGKDFERKNYKRMLKKLRKGDCIVVKSLDRFGRNYKEVQSEWQKITKKGIDIRILDMPILDTTNHKDLIGTLISDIVLQLLAYVAQTERENIKQRQTEGIAIAKAKGVQFGRKQMFDYINYTDVFEKLHRHEITSTQAMTQIGCCEGTFYKLLKKYRTANNITHTKLDKQAYYAECKKRKYIERKESHCCVYCGEKLQENNKYVQCDSCREKAAKYRKAKIFKKFKTKGDTI